MAKAVKAKIVPTYAWECPGCGESNIDSKPDREAVHDQCNMDYISVKCSNCNGSYVIEGSSGWLTKFRTAHGGDLKSIKRIETIKPEQIKYTREQLTRYEAGVYQCFLCGGHGKASDAIAHDTRCAFTDPDVKHVYAGGKL